MRDWQELPGDHFIHDRLLKGIHSMYVLILHINKYNDSFKSKMGHYI